MSDFIQLHVLTNYAPANLNRDDTGRPKTALMGGALRLRVSSQSLKRAWRTADLFETAVGGHLGKRTRLLGQDIYSEMLAAGLDQPKALEWARQIAAAFGSLELEKLEDKKKKPEGEPVDADLKKALQIREIVHVSPAERDAALTLARACAERKKGPEKDELNLLSKDATAVDVAMFGRMLASANSFNVDAAVQVAHAITVHRAEVEDDYFSAVDDLDHDSTGAGHIGERGYGAGLFYLYACVNRSLLKQNLGGDEALTAKALEGLANVLTKVSPTGMQNSYASRAYASYVLAEKGAQQPRSLSQAFLQPVRPQQDQSMLTQSIRALQSQCKKFDDTYGACADSRTELNTDDGTGSLQALVDFIKG